MRDRVVPRVVVNNNYVTTFKIVQLSRTLEKRKRTVWPAEVNGNDQNRGKAVHGVGACRRLRNGDVCEEARLAAENKTAATSHASVGPLKLNKEYKGLNSTRA